jgi:hypothetical protein
MRSTMLWCCDESSMLCRAQKAFGMSQEPLIIPPYTFACYLHLLLCSLSTVCMLGS